MATGTIKNDMTWKLVDSKTGTSAITLPSDYNELLVCCTYLHDNYFDYTFSIAIPKSEIYERTGIQRRFFDGYSASGRSNVMIRFANDRSKVELVEMYIDGSNRTSATTTRVYYR